MAKLITLQQQAIPYLFSVLVGISRGFAVQPLNRRPQVQGDNLDSLGFEVRYASQWLALTGGLKPCTIFARPYRYTWPNPPGSTRPGAAPSLRYCILGAGGSMADFDAAIHFVLEHVGGECDVMTIPRVSEVDPQRALSAMVLFASAVAALHQQHENSDGAK